MTDKYADQVATACVEQIVKIGKLTKKETKKDETKPNKLKTNEEIAKEVILGKWGNGTTRKSKLKKAGYDYNAIQKIVNKMLK